MSAHEATLVDVLAAHAFDESALQAYLQTNY